MKAAMRVTVGRWTAWAAGLGESLAPPMGQSSHSTFEFDEGRVEWLVSFYQSCMGDILEARNFKVFLERLGGVSDTI
ncbi:hypothetical protein E4O93_00020 [Diaphorobacter sp. DS2]|jgi:hypothetical protein|nr:hypothetical protein E4O93_00020 [Diaphorobacter sp. DS2]